jgi:hypothetical protein
MEEKIREKKKYKISAEIVDSETGVAKYDNIKMIRVKSNHHNLLIMEDFIPVIGEITGFIQLVFDNKTVDYKSIHGFYMHKKNKFSLLIENRIAEAAETEAEELK